MLHNEKVAPELNGELRVSFAPQVFCAGFAEDGDGSSCLERGDCDGGVCKCNNQHEGRVCDTKVEDFEDLKDGPEPSEPEGGWLTDRIASNTPIVEVNAFKTRVLKYVKRFDERFVRVTALVLKGYVPGAQHDMNVNTTVAVWATNTSDQNEDLFLKGPQVLGACHVNEACKAERDEKSGELYITYNLEEVAQDTAILIAIAANATGSTDETAQSVVVGIQIDKCIEKGICGDLVYIPWTVLPVSVVIIAMMGLAILTMLWLDRRHGFTSPVDKLTEKELERMYPTRKFRATEPLNGEEREEECLICLCAFEPDDVVRNLHCEHTYHSKCLDVSSHPEAKTFC